MRGQIKILASAASSDKKKEWELLKLAVEHIVNKAFDDSKDYKTCTRHEHSNKYNGKIAARKASLAEQIKTVTEPNPFDNFN